jgi:hypothetical protein
MLFFLLLCSHFKNFFPPIGLGRFIFLLFFCWLLSLLFPREIFAILLLSLRPALIASTPENRLCSGRPYGETAGTPLLLGPVREARDGTGVVSTGLKSTNPFESGTRKRDGSAIRLCLEHVSCSCDRLGPLFCPFSFSSPPLILPITDPTRSIGLVQNMVKTMSTVPTI